MVRAKRHSLVSLRPRNLSVPSYRPIQKDGCTETVHQLVPGSGEGQHTGTIDDYHRMDRREAHACGLLLSSLPFSTIAYQRVCWGASYIIKALHLTAYSVRACLGLPLPASSPYTVIARLGLNIAKVSYGARAALASGFALHRGV
jgi:hypothetical protein